MPCSACTRALEQGANAIRELWHFHPELLPVMAAPITDWLQLAEALVQLAGTLRSPHAPSDLSEDQGRT